MPALAIVLGSIALLDSTSMVPLCIAPLAALLAGERPLVGAGAFLGGIGIVYFLFGVVVLLGLEALFDGLNAWLERFMREPETVEICVQIAIGLVLIVFGYRMTAARETRGDRGASEVLSRSEGFAIGAGLTIVGLPGAVPFFAAADQIMRTDPSPTTGLLWLLYYVLVFLFPLSTIVLVHALVPGRSAVIFKAIGRFFEAWGRRVVVVLLIVLGAILAVDGVGVLLGYPLIPVSSSPAPV